MALTLTEEKRGVAGNLRYWVGNVAFDSSYPTNGEAIAAADLGFSREIFFLVAAPAAGLVFEFDHSADKLKALFPTGGASAPATLTDPANGAATLTRGTDVAVVVPAGATPVTSDAAQPALTITQPVYTAAAAAQVAGRGKEVGNTTDLSAVTTRVFAFGL